MQSDLISLKYFYAVLFAVITETAINIKHFQFRYFNIQYQDENRFKFKWYTVHYNRIHPVPFYNENQLEHKSVNKQKYFQEHFNIKF